MNNRNNNCPYINSCLYYYECKPKYGWFKDCNKFKDMMYKKFIDKMCKKYKNKEVNND